MDFYGSLKLPIVLDHNVKQHTNDFYQNCEYDSKKTPSIVYKTDQYVLPNQTGLLNPIAKDQLDTYIKLNTDYLIAKSQNESKINSTKALIEEEKLIEYREQKAQRLREIEEMRQFRKQFQEKALKAIGKGNIDEAIKIYSIVNNNSIFETSETKLVKSEKKIEIIQLEEEEEEIEEDDKEKQMSSCSEFNQTRCTNQKKEFDSKKYRHMICLNSNADNSYKFKLIYKAACEKNYEKTCPPTAHYHFIVNLDNYKSHLSLYYKTKPKSQYYKSFRIDNYEMFENIKKRFKMTKIVSLDDL